MHASRNPFVRVALEVESALAEGRPVVALETAAVTHGLPRAPLARALPCLADDDMPESVRECFGASAPVHAALGHAQAAAVRAEGAVPASVGMLRGELVIGLTADELDELATSGDAAKMSARDIPLVAARGGSGGTTVAGTLLACALARPRPIDIFATGGIGGVHRGFAVMPDVSADLRAIRETGTLVVTAGAKSILDLAATVEALDTLGVPLVGLGTRWFPRFLSEGCAPLAVNAVAADPTDAARLFGAHAAMRPGAGMLLCVPPPERHALPAAVMERAIEAGLRTCEERGVRGPEVTPVLLGAVAEATGGASLETNLAVLISNARIAARVAVARCAT